MLWQRAKYLQRRGNFSLMRLNMTFIWLDWQTRDKASNKRDNKSDLINFRLLFFCRFMFLFFAPEYWNIFFTLLLRFITSLFFSSLLFSSLFFCSLLFFAVLRFYFLRFSSLFFAFIGSFCYILVHFAQILKNLSRFCSLLIVITSLFFFGGGTPLFFEKALISTTQILPILNSV